MKTGAHGQDTTYTEMPLVRVVRTERYTMARTTGFGEYERFHEEPTVYGMEVYSCGHYACGARLGPKSRRCWQCWNGRPVPTEDQVIAAHGNELVRHKAHCDAIRVQFEARRQRREAPAPAAPQRGARAW
jgi:hypothetical protein